MPTPTDPLWLGLLSIALAYLIGSIPFAVVVSRAMGLADPRSYGSGNPGATNVLRTGNKKAAILTLLGDALKGCVAIWLAHGISQHGVSPAVLGAVAVAVFLGHLYPVFLKFQGGKGVATALGVLLALQPWLGLATMATWLIIAVFFRYSSLASLVAAVFAPLYYLFGSGVLWYAHPSITAAIVVISAFLIWRHRANVTRLMQGKESKIGRSKKA
ncbi:MAG: glycerol-3-phosphate 1-O-acyltransferase PlsY [Comamonadaceae bacterium]|nr:MAG: glycerol-3-phosphate 1-O-acyltransferase PlsY [Comamonadaceae bacterium]